MELQISNVKKQKKLIRKKTSFLTAIHLIMDCVIAVTVLSLLTYFKNGNIALPYQILMVLIVLIMVFFNQDSGQDNPPPYIIHNFTYRLKFWLQVTFSLLLIGFITKVASYFSREVLLIWLLIVFIILVINDYIFIKLTEKYRKNITQSNCLIIGAGQSAQKLISSINNNIHSTHKIIGYVNEIQSDNVSGATYLGELEYLDNIIEKHNIKCIYLVLSNHKLNQLDALFLKLMLKDIVLHWVPDISTLNLVNHHINEISGLPVITLSESPLAGDKLLFKTVFDSIISSIALVLLSPLLLIISLLIKLSSPGPVLFRQERHGLNNKIFKIYKFRSMKKHQQLNNQVIQAKKDDVRTTTIGKFIRRTSIDELPQLLNVIKGDMSLVGPRPHAISHNNQYQKQIDNYMARHKIKPGITGLAQITGFRGETDTLEKMQGRVRQDMAYINNWSLALDMEILGKTFFSLISHSAH